MDTTANLTLPYIMAAQAQKHVTHNEAIRALDALVQMTVLDKDLAAPPGSPANGDRYIVATSPSGAWTGHAGKIAAWQDGAWAFYIPREGWLAWVADQDQLYVFDGATWVPFAGAGSGGAISTPQGRLTLTTGVAITISDVTGATAIRYTPAAGQSVPLYDGSTFLMRDTGGELSLALDADSGHTNYHASGKTYDLFAFDDAGTVRLGSGPKWDDGGGSDVARGTGAGSTELEIVDGLWVNNTSIVLRFGAGSGNTATVAARRATFLGSFRATADGQATDSAKRRLLSNAYGQVPRPLRVIDDTDQHNYSNTTLRQYDFGTVGTANQVEVLCCLGGIEVELQALLVAGSSSSTLREVNTGIGVDSSTVDSATLASWTNVNSSDLRATLSWYRGFPGLGYRTLRLLQRGAGSDTQTWYGTNAGARAFLPGLNGHVWG